MAKPTKTISPSVRLQALGLFTLAGRHYAKLRAAELEMIDLLGQEDQGCLSDAIYGTYHHCDEKHLQRYLAEFDFRYSNRIGVGVNDSERAERVLKGVSGKRLTYRATRGRAA